MHDQHWCATPDEEVELEEIIAKALRLDSIMSCLHRAEKLLRLRAADPEAIKLQIRIARLLAGIEEDELNAR